MRYRHRHVFFLIVTYVEGIARITLRALTQWLGSWVCTQ